MWACLDTTVTIVSSLSEGKSLESNYNRSVHIAGIKLNIESEWDGIVVLSGHELEELYAWHSHWLLCSSQPVELLRCLTSYRKPKIEWLQNRNHFFITSCHHILHTIHIWLISNQNQVASSSSGFPWHPPKIDKITTMFWGSKPPQNTTNFSCSSLNRYLDILGCSIQLDPCKKTNTKVPKQNKDVPSLFGRWKRFDWDSTHQMDDPNDWTVTKKLAPTLFYPWKNIYIQIPSGKVMLP